MILNSWIDRLGPGLATTAGTNLEIALREASESFPSGVGRSKIILLITDGESLTGNIGHAARNLIQEGIFVHAAIAGTAEGGPIPLDDGTYVADESGRPVVSRADFKVIEQLVDETGGSVHDLGRAGAAAELLQAMRKDLEFAESRGISFTGVYRYRMYLLPSLLMLLLNLFARIIPWRRR